MHIGEVGYRNRPFDGEKDFWRVRGLLIGTYSLTPPGFNWDIRHWDGWFFHREHPSWSARRLDLIHLWETQEGRLIGAVHPEGEGYACLQVHPDHRHIERAMITWAEDHIAVPGNDDGKRVLHFSVFEYDSLRRRLLESLGYDKTSRSVKLYRMRFGNRLLPCPNMPKGFVLRTTCANDQGDCEKLADVLNAAFNRNFHTAKEIQTFVAMSPSHRHDLELAAEERSGSSIAFVGVTYDEANRIGIFEPVGTHPDHRRKGLTRTLMLEGMKRLAALGATDAYVGTGDAVPANRLYEAVGFTEVYEGHIWRKVF